ncbi:MAG TPA: glycosyltransferase [Candidatus Limnocylindrales bacterium]|nr:glycosyltransferase [Candidatus Limnocylindrales bacterium]
MKIGIDISQLAYSNTGVANYVKNLVENMLNIDTDNEYILFYSSLRRINNLELKIRNNRAKYKIRKFRFPPKLLDLLWNKLHIMPIEDLIGEVDVFLSSDWTQPPTKKARKITILYDLIVYKRPEETDKMIVDTQKRRLKWVRLECDQILCISNSTKADAEEFLHIDSKKLQVVYPGI